ncbi:LexA family protein [Mesorhizobium sp. A556]
MVLTHIGYMDNRIRYFRDRAGLTRDELSARMNTSTSQLTKLERGERKLTKEWMERIAEALRISPADLFDQAASQLQSVPLISTISAGVMMRDDLIDEAIRTLAVADLPPGDWFALRVDGDSMDRISPPDSIILVNRKDKRLVNNACYVIADQHGNATYKRYRPSPDRFEPVSTNPNHEPIFPDNDVPVVGRVRRSMIDM